jgi:cell division protein FtsQ
MKRPEGFDRQPARPGPVTPQAPAPSGSAPSAPPPTESAPPASGAATPTTATATATREKEAPAPAFLPTRDTSAREARKRAAAARRLARRAALARRAVERTEVRRFTRRTRHRRAVWVTAAAVVVALVGAVTISVFSPLLSLQTIEVQGTSRVDKQAVLRSLDGQIGKPLARVDFGAVKRDLSDFPLIESYVTEERPPHTLVIRITEREPIASVQVGKGYELVDPAGVVISTSPSKPKDVPVIDIKGNSVDGAVYRASAEVLLSLPTQVRSVVTKVTASTADDVTLTLNTGEQVVWGSAESSLQKAQLLSGLIKSHKATNPTQSVEYDVSAPDNGIIRTK